MVGFIPAHVLHVGGNSDLERVGFLRRCGVGDEYVSNMVDVVVRVLSRRGNFGGLARF